MTVLVIAMQKVIPNNVTVSSSLDIKCLAENLVGDYTLLLINVETSAFDM